MQNFVHLRLHSEYSLRDSLVRLDPLVARVAELGMSAVAVSDEANFFGLVKFYRAALERGVKPLFAVDLPVREGGGNALQHAQAQAQQSNALCLLAMNAVGYRNLTELITLAYRQGQRLGAAQVEKEWIARHAEGVLALSAGRAGDIGQALLAGNRGQAEQRLDHWMEVFPDRFYLELHRTGRDGEEDYLHAAVDLGAAKGCPVAATNDVRFLSPEEFEAHEARVCISESRVLNDQRRARNYSAQQYLRSPEEMLEVFSDIPEALANTVEIARRCNAPLDLGKPCLPAYSAAPEGVAIDELLRSKAHAGLDERLKQRFDPAAEDFPETEQRYRARLDFELDTIIQMDFTGYFLIVMDFIHWAQGEGIPVGPGRGSGAGSLAAYALGITGLDPLQYDLLFERFLNPERQSMPDFDVDFCVENRDRVIHYVMDIYGREAVAQIISFGTMAAKAVVRDVARVQGKSYGLADRMSKLIPQTPGMTLQTAREQEPLLQELLEHDGDAQEIWGMARQLEGLARNLGTHAGGVVIAPSKLTDFAPLYCDDAGDGLLTHYDKDDVESVGLVKFDLLGLTTLTIIDWAVKIINEQRAQSGEAALDLDKLPLDDAKTYKLLQSGKTSMLFQLESSGMQELIKRVKPTCFDDIIALLALFRPGPLQSGMVDNFVRRKHGQEKISYPDPAHQHESLKPILAPTYGIILYQEQVMQVAQTLAGYTLGNADILRRAMGKKKPEEMAKERETFEAGAKAQGVSPRLAGKIFDLMEKFAGYGFNKSHSAAYAMLAYQTAWLKAHHPAPFMAAVMSAEMRTTEKLVKSVEESRRMGLTLKQPDVNEGAHLFTVGAAGEIIYGLGGVKGLGAAPVQNLIEARRDGGPFRDLFDFCRRTDPKKTNRRAVEALIKAGAFDSLGEERALVLAAMDSALRAAQQAASNAAAGMTDMFAAGGAADGGEANGSGDGGGDAYADFRAAAPWSEKEKLAFEKEALGLWLTGHPIKAVEKELREFAPTRIADMRPGAAKSQTVAGLIVETRTRKTRSGDSFASIKLDDCSDRIEVTLYSDAYNQHRELLVKDNIVIIDGAVSHDDYSGGLSMRANAVRSFEQARAARATELRIDLSGDAVSSELLDRIEQLIRPAYHAKGCPITFRYRNAQYRALIRANPRYRIRPTEDLLQNLRTHCGPSNVTLSYSPPRR